MTGDKVSNQFIQLILNEACDNIVIDQLIYYNSTQTLRSGAEDVQYNRPTAGSLEYKTSLKNLKWNDTFARGPRNSKSCHFEALLCDFATFFR